MRAQSLSVCIPWAGCDKNCPYCVSQITGLEPSNHTLMMDNLPKVRTLAKAALVSTVLFTSKGEPFVNYGKVLLFLSEFKDYWTEIQTNGIWLSNNLYKLPELQRTGLNIVAVSVDCMRDMNKDLFKAIRKAGMVCRVTFNITNDSYIEYTGIDRRGDPVTFQNLVDQCKESSVHQMTLRNIVRPNFTEEVKQSKWIEDNVDPLMYERLRKEMIAACESKGQLLRSLEYGSKVYDYEDISVSYSDYCIQDTNEGDDIRSLIFQENGHCYTSWNSKASILF